MKYMLILLALCCSGIWAAEQLIVMPKQITNSDLLVLAVNERTDIVLYDIHTATLESIAEQIKACNVKNHSIQHLGLALHGTENGHLTITVDDESSFSRLLVNKREQEFWKEIGGCVQDGGSIDLLSCSYASGEEGELAVAQLAALTGHRVNASRTDTSSYAGDWFLEHGGVRADQRYFGLELLKKWNGFLAVHETKFLPMGDNTDSYYGLSVSIDGNYKVVGAYGENDYQGAAYVYGWNGTNWVMEQRLTASDGDIGDEFGSRVSISGDRCIIGAYKDDYSSGSAYVFSYDGTEWDSGVKLVASDAEVADIFGCSVSISGSRCVIGAFGDDDGGSAYVFSHDGASWDNGIKLVAGDVTASDYFGSSVSISGSRCVIGSYRDDDGGSDSGSAYVFSHDGTSWDSGVKLVASDAAANDLFGHDVSISGTNCAISAPTGNSAYVFSYDGTSWGSGVKLVASDFSVNDYFGYGVSISGDRCLVGGALANLEGTTSVFSYDGAEWDGGIKLETNDGVSLGGAMSISGSCCVIGDSDDDHIGSAYVFALDGETWSQQQKTVPTENWNATDDKFGYSVSVSGNRCVIGALCDDDGGSDSGGVYVLSHDGTSWDSGVKLVASDAASYDYFGSSVSISGSRCVIGAYGDNGKGSAYVFSYDGTSWDNGVKLVASDADFNDKFGFSVSISGSCCIIGAFGDDDGGSGSGSAYIFSYDGTSWDDGVKLVASDAAASDYFGRSVSISGSRCVIGAYGDNGTGSAYVFNHSGTSWDSGIKLVASDAATNDGFGYSVSISENRCLIGAYGDDGAGSAYAFSYNGMGWDSGVKLVANDAAASDYFGSSVSLSGTRCIIGARYDDDGSSGSGSAYVFSYDGISWDSGVKLVASDAAASDYFGSSVSISGSRCIVGSYQDDDAGSNSGSAYEYILSGPSNYTVTFPEGVSLMPYSNVLAVDILSLFQPLIDANELEYVRWINPTTGMTKELYYNLFPAGWVNKIGNIKPGQGYIVKVNRTTALVVSGNRLSTELSHDLPEGYSLIAYTNLIAQDAQTAFNDIIESGKLDVVRWVDPTTRATKELYYETSPARWVNEIGSLQTDQAYIIKLNAPYDTFAFPVP